MAPSLPIPAKLATAILEALNAVVNGHMPTVGDRRRAATAFIQLTLELDRFERNEPELSAQLDDAMDQAMTPGGFDHPPSIPIELAPTRRGRPALTKPSCARPRKQHPQEPRPPSADRHRIPRKNCCPCCGRRIPRNRRGKPLIAGTPDAPPPTDPTSPPEAQPSTCHCACTTPRTCTSRAAATAIPATATPTPRTPSPTRAAARSHTSIAAPSHKIGIAHAPTRSRTPPPHAHATTKTTPTSTTPNSTPSTISDIAFRPHPTIIKLLRHIRTLRAGGHIFIFSALWVAELKALRASPPPNPKPP